MAVFGTLLPAGYIADDIRYGQCIILTTGQTGGGGSYNLFSSEQSCRQGCVISGNVGVSIPTGQFSATLTHWAILGAQLQTDTVQ